MRASYASSITKIVLERVGGGPQPNGHGWPQDKIVLRPQAEADIIPPDEFLNLANWLKKSGFFTRKFGYRDRASIVPSDVGYLRIIVVQGGEQKQVYSYNGQRDAELWQTEMTIRGAAAAIKLRSEQVAWLKNHPVL